MSYEDLVEEDAFLVLMGHPISILLNVQHKGKDPQFQQQQHAQQNQGPNRP